MSAFPPSISTTQATAATQTVSGSIDAVLFAGNWWTINGSSVSYSTAGLNMHGTLATAGTVNTYALQFMYSGYSDNSTGYTLNGALNFSATIDGATQAQSWTVTGDVTSSGGPVTAQTWDVSVGGTTRSPTYAGTIACNKYSFDASTLSLQDTTQAAIALATLLDGARDVFTAFGSWTFPGGLPNVQYSAGNLNMTGTLTTAGSINTFNLTISFAGYFDPATGYTAASGSTLSLLYIVDTGPGSLNGTITTNAILSGGPVTGMSATLSVSRAATASQTFVSGTATADGTTFDAKTL